MKKINLCNGDTLDILDAPIGIIASGGADSSILLYLLMREHKLPIHIFTCSNTLKGRANAIIISKVLEKCIQLTNNLNIYQHNYYVSEQTKDNIFTYPKTFYDENKIAAIYTGTTANPPYDIVEKFKEPNSEDFDRTPLIKRPTWLYNNIVHNPFTNLNKKDINNMFIENGVIESLFPLTRSCEKDFDNIEYYDHCGECWWCEERLWGFGKL